MIKPLACSSAVMVMRGGVRYRMDEGFTDRQGNVTVAPSLYPEQPPSDPRIMRAYRWLQQRKKGAKHG